MNSKLPKERTITVGFFGVLVVGGLVSWWYLVSSQTNVSAGCLPTQPDAQGPYYQEEAPKRQDIVPSKTGGEKLIVRGRVVVGCNQLVAGAKLEVWQADSQGEYSQAWFRGTMYTDEGGNYEVETVMPGAYTQGGVIRPPHIHFKVTLPDGRQLTSQMYFDSRGGVDPSRLVSLEKTPEGLRGSFDIVFGG